MKIPLENLKAFFISFSLIYFFSPFALIGVNELYPWYVFITLLIWTDLRQYLLVIFGFIIIILIAMVDLKTALDFAQIVVIVAFLFWYTKISQSRSMLIVVWMQRFLLFLTIFLLLQISLPNIFGPITNLFAFREGLNIDGRTGGVRGIAPEPSYMAMTLIGVGVVLWFEKGKLNLKDQILISLSVLMCGSIVGYGGLLLLLATNNQKYLMEMLAKFFGSGKVSKFLPYLIFLIVFLIYSFWSIFISPLTRFYDLFIVIVENWDGTLKSILLAENKFGSDRLQELLPPFTSLCCGFFFTGEFNKNFSLYGLVWAFFAPMHFLLLYPLVIKPLVKRQFTSVRLFSIMMFLVFGPVLIVSLYLGFVRRNWNVQKDS